ncbi:MAG: class I SAM-dependent methyltransferase [Candidatus Eisenbacteria bacterium]|jgi:SAM-dependent methyltransferase|nr:class I SAM-dependent methyltransferase [Candidatus Eisenbacteria bacterium]
MTATPRLYDDLAWLWPLWGAAEGDYALWCAQVVRLIRQYATGSLGTILDIGCGGGKNAFNLKRHLQVTGLDLSPAMLELARALNPESEFLQGDMRSLELRRRFDCILLDDAITYMVTREDLAAAFAGAFRHLRSGGVMVVSPDETKETFQQNRTRVSYAETKAKPESIDVVFVENDYDPDPADDQFDGTLVYLIREAGRLRVETDRHVLGLFPLEVWRTTLRSAGFEVHEEAPVMPDTVQPVFVCVKP